MIDSSSGNPCTIYEYKSENDDIKFKGDDKLDLHDKVIYLLKNGHTFYLLYHKNNINFNNINSLMINDNEFLKFF